MNTRLVAFNINANVDEYDYSKHLINENVDEYEVTASI